MKQFILAASVATSKPANVAAAGTNKLSIYEENGMFNLLVGHGADLPTDLLIVDKKNLEVTVTNKTAATTFSQEITIPTPVDGVDYAFQFSKGGAVFNERNNWTTSVTKTDSANTATLMAAKLAKQINMMTNNNGLKATATAAKVTVTAVNAGEDFTIKTTVEGPGVTASTAKATLGTKTKGLPGIADVAFIKELAHKCMGDKGIGYTYVDAAIDTYNIYNNEGNAVDNAIDAVVNIRCYNPRYDHRIDEPLYQMIHIACKASDATTIASTLVPSVSSASAASDNSAED